MTNYSSCVFIQLKVHEKRYKGGKIDFLVLQEKQRVVYDEQKKLAQQQAQIKSQMARYEDELARKRMQACESLSICCMLGLHCHGSL